MGVLHFNFKWFASAPSLIEDEAWVFWGWIKSFDQQSVLYWQVPGLAPHWLQVKSYRNSSWSTSVVQWYAAGTGILSAINAIFPLSHYICMRAVSKVWILKFQKIVETMKSIRKKNMLYLRLIFISPHNFLSYLNIYCNAGRVFQFLPHTILCPFLRKN